MQVNQKTWEALRPLVDQARHWSNLAEIYTTVYLEQRSVGNAIQGAFASPPDPPEPILPIIHKRKKSDHATG